MARTPQRRSTGEATRPPPSAKAPKRRCVTEEPTKASRLPQPAKKPAEALDGAEPLALTPGEAASALRISPRSLWTWTQAGSIPHVRIGRRILYRRADLETWLARRAAASVRGRRSAD